MQFFLVGLDDSTQLSLAGARKWDVKGKFGGPETMFTDGPLRNAAIQAQACTVGTTNPGDITDTDWTALRTAGEINDRDKAKTLVLAKVGLKAAGAATPNQEQVYFFTGGWKDDGDQVPESNELGCAGGTITGMTIR